MKKNIKPTNPFISNPEIIIFRDFIIGETMELEFELTNVSYSRNTFKLIGIDKEYENLFEIKCSPPGFISPGVSVPLLIKFFPKFNDKLKIPIHFLSEIGPFDIFIECYPQIINIQIEPFEKLDFDTVTLGDDKELSIIIRNSGALSSIWSFDYILNPSIHSNLTISEIDETFNFSIKHGIIKGYSTSNIKVGFKPLKSCNLSLLLNFKFTSQNQNFEPFSKTLIINAICLDVPLFFENNILNFGVCYFNEIYRQSLKIYNRTDLSQRFNIESNFDSNIEFTPKIGFVQPKSNLLISIKINLTPEFLLTFSNDGENINLQFKIFVINQVLPLYFNLLFIPSYKKVLFNPNLIDFGTFYSSECSIQTLNIQNLMEMPINFGFLKLPQGINIQPFNGFGTLNPNEKLELKVKFESNIVKKYNFEINCYTLQGLKFPIKCIANILSSPINLNYTSINFESIPLGEQSIFNLKVENTKSNTIEIQFSNHKDIYFDPVSSIIPPKSSIPINILFKPSIPEKIIEEKIEPELILPKSPLKKEKKTVTNPKIIIKEKIKKPPSLETIQKQNNQIIDPTFTYLEYHENVLCFWKNGNNIGKHHLLINSSTTLPLLFITSIKINNNERKSQEFIDLSLKNIDFGTVAIGQSIDVFIELKNMSKNILSLETIFEVGAFEVLTPVLDILSLQNCIFRIRFLPLKKLHYNSQIIIYCPEKPNIKITLDLHGEGASPSLSINTDVIDFGYVLLGQTFTKTLSINNGALFDLHYFFKLNPNLNMYHLNRNNSECFTLPITSEWISPESEIDLLISFNPDHEYNNFESILIISAGEDGETKEILLKGSSNSFPMFVLGGIENYKPITAFDHLLLDEIIFRSSIICELSFPNENNNINLIIGTSILGDDTKKISGDFNFENLSQPGFNINPLKGLIEPGSIIKINIDYNPSNNTLLQVGQWVICETFLNLKCGDFFKKLPVKLKCLINLQQNIEINQNNQNKQIKTQSKKRSLKK